MEISKTLLAKQIKNDRLSKNLPVYDGGLGENPVPQPKCMIEYFKKTRTDETVYIIYRNKRIAKIF